MLTMMLRLTILILVFTIAQPALASPDLRFGGTPIVLSAAAPGASFTVSNLRVENQGSGFNTRSDACQVGHFLVDGSGATLIGVIPIPALNSPGGITLPDFSLNVPGSLPLGTYTFEIRIDFTNQVNETNEGNNLYTQAMELVVGVDLAFATQPVWSESIILAGGSIDVLSFEVDDLTAIGWTGSFRIGHYLTSDPGGLTELTRLGGPTIAVGPGEFPVTVPAETLTVPASLATTPGPWYFVTLLDETGVIAEDSETNNKSNASEVAIARVTWTSVFSADLGGTSGGGGVAWGDYDNDGDHDLFVARDGVVLTEDDVLLRNDGVAGWTPISWTGNSRGVVWGDLDDDGWLDLYVTRGSIFAEPNRVFHNDAGTGFTNYSATWLGLDDPGLGASVTMVDFDRDGDLDPFVSNTACSGCDEPTSHLFENQNGIFQSMSDPDIEYPECTQASAWADYDRDGDADVFVTGTWDPLAGDTGCYGYSRLLRNDGGGAFTSLSATYFSHSNPDRGCAWGDYDNDGYLDLIVVGQNRSFLYHNEGGASFVDVSAYALKDNYDGTSVFWLDYDLDGDLDLFIGSTSNESNHLLRNEGVGWFSEVTLPPLFNFGTCIGAATADYDDDGDPDIYMSNAYGSNQLLRNDQATGNHWFQLDLRGRESNSFGVGARVEITAGGVTQVREVEGGSGWLSQNSLTVEFGIGALTQIDRLVIRWPSGIVQDFTQGVPLDRRITIHESNNGATDTPPLEVSRVLSLDAPSPNPFNPRTVFHFELPNDGAVSLTVFDALGRRVRSLLTGGFMTAGPHSITWDGSDDRGRSVASGTYFCRLEAESGSLTRKAVLVR